MARAKYVHVRHGCLCLELPVVSGEWSDYLQAPSPCDGPTATITRPIELDFEREGTAVPSSVGISSKIAQLRACNAKFETEGGDVPPDKFQLPIG